MDAEVMPPGVWITFPDARVLVMSASSTKTGGAWVGHSMQLARAPKGRIQAVIVRSGYIEGPKISRSFRGVLSTISSVTILGSSSISTKAASMLLALPSLKEARLHVVNAKGFNTWRPHPTHRLEHLELNMHQTSSRGEYILDLSGLSPGPSGEAAQSNLQQLLLRDGSVVNISSLSSLTSLQSLSLHEVAIKDAGPGRGSGSSGNDSDEAGGLSDSDAGDDGDDSDEFADSGDDDDIIIVNNQYPSDSSEGDEESSDDDDEEEEASGEEDGEQGDGDGSVSAGCIICSFNIPILAPLQQLRSLILPQQCVQGPAAWRALAGLPRLQHLLLLWARLEDGDLAMGWSNFGGLTELEVVEELEVGRGLVPGCGGLRMCMPALQKLRCSNRSELSWAVGEQCLVQ